MALAKHSRKDDGEFRRERADSLIKNLKQEYKELESFNGNMKLGTLREGFGADSLDEVLRAIRQGKKPKF